MTTQNSPKLSTECPEGNVFLVLHLLTEWIPNCELRKTNFDPKKDHKVIIAWADPGIFREGSRTSSSGCVLTA